jgi:hypothetical protein
MHDEWKRRALQDFPEVRTLRERLYPLHRGVTFTHAYKPTRVRRGEEELDKAKVMQLVLQHLALNGFSSSAAAMKREGSVEGAPAFKKCFLSTMVSLFFFPIFEDHVSNERTISPLSCCSCCTRLPSSY